MPFFYWLVYGENPRPDSKAQFAQKVKLFFLLAIRPASRKLPDIPRPVADKGNKNSALVIYPQRKFSVANLSLMGHKQNLPISCRPT